VFVVVADILEIARREGVAGLEKLLSAEEVLHPNTVSDPTSREDHAQETAREREREQVREREQDQEQDKERVRERDREMKEREHERKQEQEKERERERERQSEVRRQELERVLIDEEQVERAAAASVGRMGGRPGLRSGFLGGEIGGRSASHNDSGVRGDAQSFICGVSCADGSGLAQKMVSESEREMMACPASSVPSCATVAAETTSAVSFSVCGVAAASAPVSVIAAAAAAERCGNNFAGNIQVEILPSNTSTRADGVSLKSTVHSTSVAAPAEGAHAVQSDLNINIARGPSANGNPSAEQRGGGRGGGRGRGRARGRGGRDGGVGEGRGRGGAGEMRKKDGEGGWRGRAKRGKSMGGGRGRVGANGE